MDAAFSSLNSTKQATVRETVWKWAEERGLNVELMQEIGFEVGASKNSQPALIIPYVRDGRTYVRKYRSVGAEKGFYSSPTGQQKSLWNIDALRQDRDKPIIITEGELDAVACIQAGFDRVASLPDGWSRSQPFDIDKDNPGARVRPILEVEELLRQAPYVLVAGDADATGENFMFFMKRFLPDCEVRYAVWPDGCKDANDVLRDHGAETLNRCLQRAERLDPPGVRIFSPLQGPPIEPRRILRPEGAWAKTIALEVGQISVSTGKPGSGKSTFATFIADQIRRCEGVRVGLLMLETPRTRLEKHLALLAVGKLPHGCTEEDRDKLGRYFRIAERIDFDSNLTDDADPNAKHDLSWLHYVIHQLAVVDQCKLIIIDPWNEIEHLIPRSMTYTTYANTALTKMRNWANLYGCHIHLIAHPRKMEDGKVPGGYDIADSAAFFNKPALGWTVENAEPENDEALTRIHLWKIRDREEYQLRSSVTGCFFDPQMMTFRYMGKN